MSHGNHEYVQSTCQIGHQLKTICISYIFYLCNCESCMWKHFVPSTHKRVFIDRCGSGYASCSISSLRWNQEAVQGQQHHTPQHKHTHTHRVVQDLFRLCWGFIFPFIIIVLTVFGMICRDVCCYVCDTIPSNVQLNCCSRWMWLGHIHQFWNFNCNVSGSLLIVYTCLNWIS